jgi:y4mF family transcriptional regulator
MNEKELQRFAKELGELLAFHRKKSGLTQLEAAKLAGIGKAAVFDIEHGKTTVQLNTLLKLFSVLNIRLHLESPLMEAFKQWKK